jgi:hypothetical protein
MNVQGIQEHTPREMAFDICSSGGGSDGGVPDGMSARKGMRLVYLSTYASSVTIS